MSVAHIYRVATQYNGTDLFEIDYAQSTNRMYLGHLNYPPTKLIRNSDTNWVFSAITFAPTVVAPTGLTATATTPNTDALNSGAGYFPESCTYVVAAVVDATGVQSIASNGATATNDLTLKKNYTTLTWTAEAGVDRYYIYKARSTGAYGYIGNTTSTSFVDDNIGPDYTQGPVQAYNPFSTALDYPSTVGFHQQRLVWARTNNHPNAIYFSVSGEANYESMNFSAPQRANDAFSFGLVGGTVDAINQLLPSTSLLALTSDSIFNILGSFSYGTQANGAITPTDFISRRQNGRGSSRLKPLLIDSVGFYQSSVGSSIRTLGYQFQADVYDSNDITIFSPHLFQGFTIVSWCYAQEPLSVIWAVRNDGTLLAFTWDKDQQVWGWTVCETNGSVESVSSVFENGESRIYLIVVRNGKRVIERMASAIFVDEDTNCYLDSAITYSFSTPQTQLTNLDHLEGMTIAAVADKNVVTGLIVTNGSVILPIPASKVTAGLPYDTLIETLQIATNGQNGWDVGTKLPDASKALLNLVNSRGVFVGPEDDRLFEIKSRTTELPDQPNMLMNGLYEINLSSKISLLGPSVVVKQTDPLPFTLTGIFLDTDASN